MRTLSRPNTVRAAAQIIAFVCGLLFFQNIWPRSIFGVPPLVTVWTPILAWLPPFIVYAFWPSPTKRLWQIIIGNVLLLTVYGLALKLLELWSAQLLKQLRREAYEQCSESGAEACLSPDSAFPPSPPLYWEWLVGFYFAALLGLYVAMFLTARRARPSGT